MSHRQRAEQQRIDQPERRGAGPDRQRERKNGRGGGHLAFHNLTPAEDGVGAKRIEPPDEPDITALFALPQRGTERLPSFGGIATVLDGLFEVRLNLLVDLAAQAIATDYI
jgi:hypothetical protein